MGIYNVYINGILFGMRINRETDSNLPARPAPSSEGSVPVMEFISKSKYSSLLILPTAEGSGPKEGKEG